MRLFVRGCARISEDPPENSALLDLDSLFKNHPDKRALIQEGNRALAIQKEYRKFKQINELPIELIIP